LTLLDNIFKRPKFIGMIRRRGWRDYLPFYRVFCAVPGHGYYDDYPHGHMKEFRCPKCRGLTE
jgi:hypothetical protein